MNQVYVQEVAARDGFQVEPRFIPTEEKIAFVNALSRTGIAKIEVTSFVSPKAVPNLRDAEEVMRSIERRPGVLYTALVPNVRGAERALQVGVDELNLVMSASESHNRANLKRSKAESLKGFEEIIQVVRGRASINGSISTAFGCPFEGNVPEDRVLDLAERYLELGFRGVTLADTTGMAHPKQVAGLTEMMKKRFPGAELTLHFHNTRGMGLANAFAALEVGGNRFDASLGGLGGCPFAPGATGNICTEDLVHMLAAMDYDTGIDLDALLLVARRLPQIVGHEVPGQVAKAGKITDLHRLAEVEQ